MGNIEIDADHVHVGNPCWFCGYEFDDDGEVPREIYVGDPDDEEQWATAVTELANDLERRKWREMDVEVERAPQMTVGQVKSVLEARRRLARSDDENDAG